VAFTRNTDRDWEIWGKTNPYFGVLSDPKFLNENLNEELLQEFFASGESHVQHVYSTIRTHIQAEFQPARVLDYGCGVGRLVIPFAKRAEDVVGLDVSAAMLQQARDNCATYGASSASLLSVEEMGSLRQSSFGLIHSFIVFQHIPVARGELILRKLIGLIEAGGIGAFHFTYSSAGSRSLFRRKVSRAFQRVGLLRGFRNLSRKMPFSAPAVEMNEYSMDRIFDILFAERCGNLYVEILDHGAIRGAMLYFQKHPK